MKYVIEFIRERETTNMIRFKEIVPEGEDKVCGTLYITKKIYNSLDKPKNLKVTVEDQP